METEETFYTFDTIEDLEELPTLIFELELQLELINSKLKNDNTKNLLTKNVSEIESLLEQGRDEICDATEALENTESKFLICKETVLERQILQTQNEYITGIENINFLLDQITKINRKSDFRRNSQDSSLPPEQIYASLCSEFEKIPVYTEAFEEVEKLVHNVHEDIYKNISLELIAKLENLVKYPRVGRKDKIQDTKIDGPDLFELRALKHKLEILANNTDTDLARCLTSPFKKRFQAHFCKKSSVNNPAHPEWWLSKLLDWIENNLDFICEYFNLGVEFANIILKLGHDKTENELKFISDQLKLNLVDEVLQHEENLRDSLKLSYNLLGDRALTAIENDGSTVSLWLSAEYAKIQSFVDKSVGEVGTGGESMSFEDITQNFITDGSIETVFNDPCYFKIISNLLK